MSYGRPVVASAVGGVPELVEDGVTGYISENTAEEFAKKLRMLVHNNDLYKTISHNARNRLCRNFTIKKMADEDLKIYSQKQPDTPWGLDKSH
jgi:glycosyltransferase involved in cell wall biosynthesis